MTQIKSELLLCSKNSVTDDYLYTFRLTYPRIILSECLTHRAFSRNTSSTRAIPTIKMIKAVINNMFVPGHIGSAKSGMQAGAEITGIRRTLAELTWKAAGYTAAFWSYLLYKLGVAKQISGRVIEPFSWVTQICSMTDIDNFFALRNHPAAEPHLHQLAAMMQEQTEEAVSELAWMEAHDLKYWATDDGTRLQILNPGEWHLPLLHPWEWVGVNEGKKISAARCARTSYTLLDTGKESSMEKDIELCNKLLTGQHLSPFEHQAEAIETSQYVGNFRGWMQYRKELERA